MRLRLILGLLVVMAGAPVLAAEDPLRLEGKIALGTVVGRIDHLAIDLKRQRLLISELGNNSLGVVDIPVAKLLKRVTGLSEPQGVGYEPSSDRVYVANAGDGTVKILAAETLSPVGVIKLGEDADNVRIESPDRVLVGYGNGAIAVLQSGKRIADLPLAAHPESFQLDPSGDRLFVNEPEATRVGVIERKTGREIGRWRVPGAGANFPMALDPAGHRLFVVYRAPPTLAEFDTTGGEIRARISTCSDADDVFSDPKRKRLYISCGEGAISVVAVGDQGLTEIARIPTRQGARTSLFVPELDRLFLAVRAAGNAPAEIWVYRPNG
jgi:DNA-binding beta-propeller fold protein YncE